MIGAFNGIAELWWGWMGPMLWQVSLLIIVIGAIDRLIRSWAWPEVRHALCSLCERCIITCPYEARRLDEDEEKVVVDELMCQGCGSCAMVCPNSASVLRGYRDQQMFEIIDAALEGIG